MVELCSAAGPVGEAVGKKVIFESSKVGDILSINLIGSSINFSSPRGQTNFRCLRRYLGWHSTLRSTVCKVRLENIRVVEEYCPPSEDIFYVQGAFLDAEHSIFSVKAFR